MASMAARPIAYRVTHRQGYPPPTLLTTFAVFCSASADTFAVVVAVSVVATVVEVASAIVSKIFYIFRKLFFFIFCLLLILFLSELSAQQCLQPATATAAGVERERRSSPYCAQPARLQSNRSEPAELTLPSLPPKLSL